MPKKDDKSSKILGRDCTVVLSSATPRSSSPLYQPETEDDQDDKSLEEHIEDSEQGNEEEEDDDDSSQNASEVEEDIQD